MTAYSAIRIFGRFSPASPREEERRRPRRALVVGASGGVGHLALQLLVAWGAEAAAACGGGDAAEMATSLGAADVLDYRADDYEDRLRELKGSVGAFVYKKLYPVGYNYAFFFFPLLEGST